MADSDSILSAAHIKYLIVINELDYNETGIRCVSVADTLHITKPSVHTMMNTLKKMELIEKDRYGMACLTEQGRAFAERYSRYYKTVCMYFDKILPKDVDLKTVACALLAEIPIDGLEVMCKRISG